jgi:hypothetical protein
MAKALRVVGQVAGAAALVLSVVAPPLAPIAAAVATVANVGAQLLAPKPIARGSPAQVTIDIEPPRPYAVGLVMTGGVMRHDVAYGPTLKKVPNPYRWQVRVLSGVGPISGFVGDYFDFEPIGTFYADGFLSIARQNGNRPEASALLPPIVGTGASPAPGWDASSKLSGCAAVGLNLRFDKDGKRYASGLPVYTALIEGEKVYDPRLDSTYPGGSGPCRAGVESTYVYSANPACHALTYALGRFQNGVRVFGLGQPADTIDLPAIVDWANDCDANGWTVNMVLTEGGTGANLREQRVRNLDDLCAAGGGRWYQAGGLLSFDWHRPRVSLATLTDDDILEAGGGTDAVPTVRDRMNGVRPQYVSPAHNWQQITADEIIGSTYRAEDGEPLTQVYPLNGVTNPEQAGELAAYAMADSREIGPMDVQAKVNWRFYRPGDCITVDSGLMAYDGQAVINQRSLNPQTLAVSLSLKSETPGKHDFALGKVANPPPTPVLAQTAEERDLLANAALTPRAVDVEFDDGTNAEELKPGEGGATRNVPRGTYEAGTTYVRGDTVIFSGSSYQLIVASSTGNAPPDVARWALTANAGSGPAGADGLPGLTVIVSNEAHVVATAPDGTGGDYSAAGGQMRLLRGDTVLTPTFSIPAKTPNTSWISIDSSGNFTVSDPGVDLATATIRASWAGVNYDRTYTLAKSKQGVTGPRLALVADNQAFTFTDGAANPGSQTITLTALLNNLSGTATWSTTPSVPLGGTGNTRTLSVANFGSNRQVTVEATLGGITDRITVVRLERDVSAPANANRVRLSLMEGDSGYGVLFNPSGLSAPTDYGSFEGQRFFRVQATATAPGQQISVGNAPSTQAAFRLNPNERISVQARVEAQGAGATGGSWTLALWGFLPDGTQSLTAVGSVSGSAPRAIGNGHVQFFADVPSNIVGGRLELYGNSGGTGLLQVVISEPMVTSAAPGQTVHPPFTPGPVLTGPIDAGGPLLIGQLPTDKAVADLRNTTVTLAGLRSARPVSGAFIGQRYNATDTREAFRWDGFNWQAEADVTTTVSGPADIVMQFRADLSVTSPLPLTADYQLGVAGASPLTSGVSWSVAVLSGTFSGAAPSMVGSGGGQLRVPSPLTSPEAELRITASVGGRASPPFVAKLRRQVAAPSVAALIFINSSTFAIAHDQPIQITLPAGVSSVSLTAVSDLFIDPNAPVGGTTVEGKWQRETSPGTWADVGAVATSSPNPEVFETEIAPGEFVFSAEPGSITCNRTASGLTPGTIQRFRFVARISLGNVRGVRLNGNASAIA